MRNLITGISLSILFVSTVSAQKGSKYVRRNSDAPIFEYVQSKTYSRSIVVKDSFVFTGNSKGELIKYNMVNGESVNLMKSRKFEEMRDIFVFDDYILGMQSGTNGVLAQASYTIFQHFVLPPNLSWRGIFMDGMDFYKQTGFIMGDPVNNYFSLYFTTDGGKNWNNCAGKIMANDGEAGFAASGTNVQVLNDSTLMFVSGGSKSRFFKSTDLGKTWINSEIPFLNGDGMGAFSFHFVDDLNGVVVGGDYTNPDMNLNNSYFTTDGGKFWQNSQKQVNGYRSCVIAVGSVYYACGTNGIDISFDYGNTWIAFAFGNFFAMAADENYLYATIPDGKFQRFELVKK